MHRALYVGNLASLDDLQELTQLFAQYGMVLFARAMHGSEDQGPRDVHAVIAMLTESEAAEACEALNAAEFHGARLEVRPARASEETAAGHTRMFEPMNMPDEWDAGIGDNA